MDAPTATTADAAAQDEAQDDPPSTSSGSTPG